MICRSKGLTQNNHGFQCSTEVQSKKILEESVRRREGRQGLEKKKNRDLPGEAKGRMLGAPAGLGKTRGKSTLCDPRVNSSLMRVKD